MYANVKDREVYQGELQSKSIVNIKKYPTLIPIQTTIIA